MKTKMKFSDIAGMLERDEMKEIFGGCGNACGVEDIWSNAGGISRAWGVSSAIQTGIGGSTSGNGGFTTNDPNQIKQIMSALTGNTYSYDPKVVYGNGQVDLGGITIYTHNKSNSDSAAQTLNAVAFGWDIKTMLSQLAAGGNSAGDLAGYLKYLEYGGLVGVAAGAYSTIKDGLTNEWYDYHTADLGTQALIFGAATAVPVAGWALGAAYFLGNYYTERNYGEGLYEHLNSN